MTAVAVELLTRPPEPADVPRSRHAAGARAGCRRVRRRHRYAAHDVLVQREQRPAVLRLSNPRGLTGDPASRRVPSDMT